jgi:dTDP-4-amino-4,6-dideoxygalactose transaminase
VTTGSDPATSTPTVPQPAWRIPLSSPSIDSSDIAAVQAVLETSRLASGPATEQLESLASDTLGCPSVLCSSGTAGLMLALRALGVTGGEVITPALGFIATAHAIRAVGATPRFCDVDPHTLCVGVEQLEADFDEETAEDPDSLVAEVEDFLRNQPGT